MPLKYKSTKEYQKFGITMAIALMVVFAIIVLKNLGKWDGIAGIFAMSKSLPYIFATSFTFLLTTVISPKSLAPFEFLWMKLAHYLGIIVTTILVTLTFYLIITPTGFLLKLLRKDLLKLKFEKDTKSYWVAVEEDGPGSRQDRPY